MSNATTRSDGPAAPVDSDDLTARVASLLADEPGDVVHAADRHVRALAPLLRAELRARIVERAVSEATGLGLLQELLLDETVSEVMVNGGGEVWVDRAGQMACVATLTSERVEVVLERILAPVGRRVDRTSPVVDARLPDGSRVCAVVPPVAVDGTVVCIRRFRVRPVTLDEFAPADVVDLLAQAVAARCNILVSGATSAGKTTLLNALATLVPESSRLVTLEDVAELRLGRPHVVRLETRPASPEGVPAIELRHLVRTALRLRPDRIVVGEVRGAEAFDLLQALNTGHDGSLATLHANGPADALRRLTSMILQDQPMPASLVLDLIHSAVDLVVHVGRTTTGQRRVTEVAELGAPAAAGSDHAGALRLLANDRGVLESLGRRRLP